MFVELPAVGRQLKAGEACAVGVDVQSEGTFCLARRCGVPEVDVVGPDGSGGQAAVGVPVEHAAEYDVVAV